MVCGLVLFAPGDALSQRSEDRSVVSIGGSNRETPALIRGFTYTRFIHRAYGKLRSFVSTSGVSPMNSHLLPEEKLAILQAADSHRKWFSSTINASAFYATERSRAFRSISRQTLMVVILCIARQKIASRCRTIGFIVAALAPLPERPATARSRSIFGQRDYAPLVDHSPALVPEILLRPAPGASIVHTANYFFRLFFAGNFLRLVFAKSRNCFSLIDCAISFEAPLSDDLERSPRFAAKAAPAAICCFFDRAGIHQIFATQASRGCRNNLHIQVSLAARIDGNEKQINGLRRNRTRRCSYFRLRIFH